MELGLMKYEGEEQLGAEIAPVVKVAQGLAIVDQATRDEAVIYLKKNKAAQARVVEWWAKLRADATETWRKATAAKSEIIAREEFYLTPLKEGEKIAKDKVKAFDAEVEAKRQAEERRLQAEANERARKERERMEAAARRLRQKEEEARAVAEAAQSLAEAASAGERAILLKEAEAAEKKASAAAAKAETREEAATEVFAPVVTVASAIETQKGESTRTRWKAELVDKHLLVAAAAQGNGLAMSLLEFNQVAANRQATASRNNIQVPGVKFHAVKELAIRGEG